MIYDLIHFKRERINDATPEDERIYELIDWCNQLHQKGFLTSYKNLTEQQREMKKQFIEKIPEKGSDGNLSFRLSNNRFIITGSQLESKKNLEPKDFVIVESCEYSGNSCEIKYSGHIPPSSETMLHDLIYKNVHEASAIFHGHDDPGLIIIDNLLSNGIKPDIVRGAITKYTPKPGTKETPDAVIEVLNNDIGYVIILGHGFVSIGRTMEEAGKLAIENSTRIRNQAKKLGIIE